MITAKEMHNRSISRNHPWVVSFKRDERVGANGTLTFSTPVFRRPEAIEIVANWIDANCSGDHAFIDQSAVMFEDKTDALMCFTFFA